jgi:hypothetical protein
MNGGSMKKIGLLCMALLLNGAQGQINLSGTVTDKSGNKLKDVIVTLERFSSSSTTDVNGTYSLHALSVNRQKYFGEFSDFVIKNGAIIINNDQLGYISAEIFKIDGTLLYSNEIKINSNRISIPLLKGDANSVSIVRIKTSNNISVWKKSCGQYSLQSLVPVSFKNSIVKNVAVAAIDTLRASKAGYKSVRLPVNSTNGTINFVIDSLITNIGTSTIDDGSADRIAKYGVNQYFWGQLDGKDKPIVMITHAVSPDAVDIAVVFNPWFFDLTYGTNALGWKHTYNHLVKSDHVAIAVVNGSKDTVFAGKLDLISATTKSPSGYACLGPFGGDGALDSGDPNNIISYGSSLDENINYYGYHLFENSPKTDTNYTPDPLYPYWQFYPIYRISLKRSAFGQSGYGSVEMTYCHASPSKDQETVDVTEKLPPKPGTPEDPFRFYVPMTKIIKKPPVDTIPGGGVD